MLIRCHHLTVIGQENIHTTFVIIFILYFIAILHKKLRRRSISLQCIIPCHSILFHSVLPGMSCYSIPCHMPYAICHMPHHNNPTSVQPFLPSIPRPASPNSTRLDSILLTRLTQSIDPIHPLSHPSSRSSSNEFSVELDVIPTVRVKHNFNKLLRYNVQ